MGLEALGAVPPVPCAEGPSGVSCGTLVPGVYSLSLLLAPRCRWCLFSRNFCQVFISVHMFSSLSVS